jgi:hypothetical protein
MSRSRLILGLAILLAAPAFSAESIQPSAGRISAWEHQGTLSSPDGSKSAVFDGTEISMGGPAIGTIVVEGHRLEPANGSMAWSEDSRYLAFPQWTPGRMQILSVYDTELDRMGRWEREGDVYETFRFEKGVVETVMNPATSALRRNFRLADVIWQD